MIAPSNFLISSWLYVSLLLVGTIFAMKALIKKSLLEANALNISVGNSIFLFAIKSQHYANIHRHKYIVIVV